MPFPKLLKSWDGEAVSGFQLLNNNTRVYLYLKPEQTPESVSLLKDNGLVEESAATGKDACVVLKYGKTIKKVSLRYGISFIDETQAKKNLNREIRNYDLKSLMGGPENFVSNLDAMFSKPLGKSKFEFYAQLPDHTGNVGQFSMANEPSLHIPYLYNYAGKPWKTQKWIRALLKDWFRNDLMGVPGDEDGGGMTSFVVFSYVGFYPMTPGMPVYNIGSPMFEKVKVHMGNGNVFEIEAQNASAENKYVQSATLNGVHWNKPWFEHKELAKGSKLVLIMGPKANRNWGSSVNDAPPSAEKIK